MNQFYCRWSPTLGELEGTHQECWGTKTYNPEKHINEPCVFFGLYGLPDFYALWRHKGKKYIFWAGSDILNFRKGYWLEDGGEINLGWMGGSEDSPKSLAQWINKHCENWVENEAEAWQLRDCGIKNINIGQSFLGNVKDYEVSFRQGNKVYLSGHEGRQDEYGWGIVSAIACSLPTIEFHLYGAPWRYQPSKNIICHGTVPKEEMNREIKEMQCGLRLNKHDGFSEITAKSVLWGQHPITYLYFPMIEQYAKCNCGQPYCVRALNNLIKLLKRIPHKRKPNLKARNYYLENLNRFPWNSRT